MSVQERNVFEKTISKVESLALARSGRKLIYFPTEKIPVIEVSNFVMLGKLAAHRFLEWVQYNPGGVIALPTGKTPEHFIAWVNYYLKNWDSAEVRNDLENNGIDTSKKVDMKSLFFVQIDEFYPMDPNHHNSYNYYVKKFYIEGFDLDPEKALLIHGYDVCIPSGKRLMDIFPDGIVDLNLRTRRTLHSHERSQKQIIEAVDQYCMEYEEKIRRLGGIGFFLGGIGPDGHIAFNVRGSDHHSTTRLMVTNYETQAAAATDLGGIEVARNRLVITIGLSTITYNKDAVAIIIAAGEEKSKIVKESIEAEVSNLYPASALQVLPKARFYLTQGSAKSLLRRRLEDLGKVKRFTITQKEKLIIDLALEKRKRILDLTCSDIETNTLTKLLLKKNENYEKIIEHVEKHLRDNLVNGLENDKIRGKIFMHTAPHHDDIMLGYLPCIIHLVRTPKNKHHFNYLTSGFTAVTNRYAINQLEILLNYIKTDRFKKMLEIGIFNPGNRAARDNDVYQYLDGVAGRDESIKNEAIARRLLSITIDLFGEKNMTPLKTLIKKIIDYFLTQYPGQKDKPVYQKLKGMIREWEADLLWGYFGFNSSSVNHLRLGFYKGDIFTEEPDIDRDVKPLFHLICKINPHIVTVALDPESSGPDTHYKVMQSMAEALKLYESEEKRNHRNEIEVWAYRNIWYRFHPSEVNCYVPVSLNSMSILQNAFYHCFGSQRNASYPSYKHDGPFSELAIKIQSKQHRAIKTCLGRDFFDQNSHPRLRANHGLCFIKKMKLAEFYQHTTELRKKMKV